MSGYITGYAFASIFVIGPILLALRNIRKG